MITEIRGNLFNAETEAIGHGVNCQGVMGKGIAKEMRRRYPDMYEEYRLTCQQGGLKPGGIFPWRASKPMVINMASQEFPGPDASVEWIVLSLEQALRWCEQRSVDSLALPHIGCGVGGLSWDDVKPWFLGASLAHPKIDVQVWAP